MKNIITTIVLALALIAVLPLQAQTLAGDGLMVRGETGKFALSGGWLTKFNPQSASTYFFNRFTGEVTCAPVRVCPCGTSCTYMDAPPAPQPDPNQTIAAANSLACAFLVGGNTKPFTYTQTLTQLVAGRWKSVITFRYSYQISPEDLVAPRKYWDPVEQQSSVDGTVTLHLTGEIAAQQVRQIGSNRYSYSFPVTSPTGASLLTSLSFAVNGLRAGIQISSSQNCAGCLNEDASALDYFFNPNAGVSGNLAGMVRTGDARTILNSDDDPTNDNGGPTGALLNGIVLRPAPLMLPVGSYVTRLSGTFGGKAFSTVNNIEVLNPSTCH